MNSWIKKPLSELIIGYRGVSFKPEDVKEGNDNQDFILLRSNNIKNGKILLEDTMIIDKSRVSDNQKLRNGDLVVCMSNGSKQLVGKSALFKGEMGDYCVGAFCSSFRIIDDTSEDFVYFLFQTNEFKNQVDITLAGSAINNLKNSTVLNFDFIIPKDKVERKKIAKVLNKIDKTIDTLEYLVKKYKRIKTGIIQDLLTKGIDSSGKIRNEDTHVFKESSIGKIPIEWDVVTSSQLSKEIKVGIVVKPSQYYVEDGVPMLRSFNIKESGIELQNLVFMTPEDNLRNSKSILKTGDVVSVRTGAPGISAVVNNDNEGSNCIDLVITTPDPDQIIPEFLVEWINSEGGKSQILKYQGGIAQQHFNVGDMKELLVPKMCLKEQKRIIESIKGITEKVNQQEKMLNKLKNIKSGLMQDLLTGKVSVTDLILEDVAK